MKSHQNVTETHCRFTLEPEDNKRFAELCGQFDQHLKQIEERLNVVIRCQGSDLIISGKQDRLHLTQSIISQLYKETGKKDILTPETVHLFIQEIAGKDAHQKVPASDANNLSIRTPKGLIVPRGHNQQDYVAAILKHDINFGIGPAGTGKTYLAVACAVQALLEEKVRRILLVRPAVEAGEKLGFLPGDLSQKVDPYLRPLYDALYEMLGFERVDRLIEKNIIEVAPLAFMRGRTLNNAFIILDESQNTTQEQMKMFLTRIGFGSTAVITGDITQVDLPKGIRPGLQQAVNVLKGVDGISLNWLTVKDVVRHPVVQRIVQAYDNYDNGEVAK